jgi:hypothetical protein
MNTEQMISDSPKPPLGVVHATQSAKKQFEAVDRAIADDKPIESRA